MKHDSGPFAMLSCGIEFFNKGYYFEAHDAFEEAWMDTRGKDRKFYQGLVQLATGLYHSGMGNLPGALSQLRKGVAKLEEFRPSYLSINVEQLVADARKGRLAIEEGTAAIDFLIPSCLPGDRGAER